MHHNAVKHVHDDRRFSNVVAQVGMLKPVKQCVHMPARGQGALTLHAWQPFHAASPATHLCRSHMPPELLDGGHLSGAADVFSLGTLYWEASRSS